MAVPPPGLLLQGVAGRLPPGGVGGCKLVAVAPPALAFWDSPHGLPWGLVLLGLLALLRLLLLLLLPQLLVSRRERGLLPDSVL